MVPGPQSDQNCSKFDRSWSADYNSIKIARNLNKFARSSIALGRPTHKFDQNCSKFDRSWSADRKRSNLDQTSAAFVRISSKIAQNFSRMWSNWLKMLQNSTFWARFSYFFEVAVRARLDLQRREPNPCFCWQAQYFQGFADFADRSKIHQN